MTGPLRSTLAIAAVLTVAGSGRSRAAAQAPVLELDHVYVVVPPGAVGALARLRQAGIIIDSSVNRHDGQGTASVAAMFENAYLELLWVDSSVAVDSLHQQDRADFVRARDWPHTGASPFGVGLHFVSGAVSELPVPFRLDSAARLQPGTYYVLLRQPEESLATDLFIMPANSAVTTWLARYARRRPDLFAHPLGVRRITRVVVRGPAPQRPRAAALQTRLVSFEKAARPHLVVEFDGGRRHATLDLRPVVPLVLVY